MDQCDPSQKTDPKAVVTKVGETADLTLPSAINEIKGGIVEHTSVYGEPKGKYLPH